MPPVKKPRRDRAPTFLRQWREYRGLTQDAAGERIGVAQTTVQRIETGQSPYNQDFLERAAVAYGCDVSDLLEINPLKPDPPRAVYTKLRSAPRSIQDRALAVLDALLKAG